MDGIKTGYCMKKILFISYDGMTDPLGQSQVIPYLSGLTKAGYIFTILSCEKKEAFAKNKKSVEKLMADAGIEWVSVTYHKNPPILSSIFDYYRVRNTAARLHKKNKYDLVHTRPGIPTLVAVYLKKKFGIKFLNDIRGFWADERVDGNMWPLKNPLYNWVYKFFKRHERECVEISDGITCLTYAAKSEIESWPFTGSKKAEVIPCSVDLQLFDPSRINKERKDALLKEMKITPGDIIFTYLGSIGGWYLTDEMMRFFKILEAKVPHAKFLFISPHRHNVITRAALRYGISEDKVLTHHASRTEVPLLLSLSDYSVFFIRKCYSKISSSPTKHGEIMAMGIPVITNSGVGDVDSIIHNSDSGFVIDDFSSAEFERISNEIISAKGVFNPEQIRQRAYEYYDLEKAIGKYSKVYADIFL
jgi:glycosyltransferase involved in cell wall biosynthesis